MIILIGEVKSKEVVDYIINLQEKEFDVIPLMGNHEALLISAYEDENNISNWILNGGNATLKSFEITSIKNIDNKYLLFFKSLKYYYSLNDFLFIHAGLVTIIL